MKVQILFFGMLKDMMGRGEDWLELPDGAVLGDVLREYEGQTPLLKTLAASLAMSVNQEYAGPQTKLKSGDEIALLPPVSGGTVGMSSGSVSPRPSYKHAAVVREQIDTQALLHGIKQSADGAAVIFEGIVRDHTRGRRTLHLDYEAYEEMALKQMEELAGQALSQFKVRDVAIVHRLGRLKIGETSVLILVASAHRGPGFEACRWLIDTLKRTVPIWKKEYFEDGAVWADGEPFPSEIPRASGTSSGDDASK